MQLVLADTWATSCRSVEPGYIRFEVEDLRSSSNKHNVSNDEEGKAVVSEILTEKNIYNNISVNVLVPIGGVEKWSVVSGYVFQKLHDRFPDIAVANAIEVSAYFSCTLYGQTLDILSLKGRKIFGTNYMCVGQANSNTFRGVLNREITKVHLKLVVDIPDKAEIGIGMKKPEQSNGSTAARKVLEEGLFSDVAISVGNGGVEIKTHKCFLSACSPVLRRMFENEMKELKTGKVEMTDASERGVKAFLRYLYYGDLTEPKEDIEIAFELLSAAHKYDVRSLENEMVKCLLERTNENFTVKLAFRVYMFVRNIESAIGLKMKTIEILRTQADQLESLEEYRELFLKPSNATIAMELFKDFAKLPST